MTNFIADISALQRPKVKGFLTSVQTLIVRDRERLKLRGLIY